MAKLRGHFSVGVPANRINLPVFPSTLNELMVLEVRSAA
jgi:hypothetical protein